VTSTIKRSRIAVIAIAVIATAGCGGGGASDPGPAPTPATVILADGDQWQYSLTGSEVLGGTNFTLNGTETVVLTATTFNGAPAFQITTTDDFMANDQHIVVSGIAYESQDPITNAVKLIADTRGPGNSLRNVTNIQVVNRGTFGTGFTSKSTITFDNGDTQTDGEIVQGHTFVTVPSGTYNTWQEQLTKNDTNRETSTNVLWVAPGVGRFVKANVNGAQPGFENHITLALMSTNVTSSTPAVKQ